MARPTRQSEIVSCASDALAPRSRAIDGRPGGTHVGRQWPERGHSAEDPEEAVPSLAAASSGAPELVR